MEGQTGAFDVESVSTPVKLITTPNCVSVNESAINETAETSAPLSGYRSGTRNSGSFAAWSTVVAALVFDLLRWYLILNSNHLGSSFSPLDLGKSFHDTTKRMAILLIRDLYLKIYKCLRSLSRSVYPTRRCDLR